jgi:V8-like Glu-specific endopeptidase
VDRATGWRGMGSTVGRLVGGVIVVGLLVLVWASWLATSELRPVAGSPTTVMPTPALPSPAALPGVRWPAVGALFDGTPDGLGGHFCSGTVIDSPGGDLVLTAAHCVVAGDGSPARTGMLFVPGYHDGEAPFGVWTVTAAQVDPGWESAADPDLDVALLAVARPDTGPIKNLTGGYRVVADTGSVNDVQTIGYPSSLDAPQVRTGATTRWSPTQLQLDAPGNYDGTSGGPWLRGGEEVIGVTGGYQLGGDSPEVSYASYLDATIPLLSRVTG